MLVTLDLAVSKPEELADESPGLPIEVLECLIKLGIGGLV